MKNNLPEFIKKCPLEDLEKKLKTIDLTRLNFFELGNLLGDIYNEVYYQLKPISNEMEKKYLEMKEHEENLKQAS